MSLQFSQNPSEDDIMMAHTAERDLLDRRANEMTDADIAAFFVQMFESAENIGLETSRDQQTIPITWNLFYSLWHTYVQLHTTITPYEFQKRHRKQLIFSGASQAIMLMFGMMPSQVDQSRWTTADRAYLSENLSRIAAAIGHDGQLLCPRPRFFSEWRRLAKLTNLADVIWAMPPTDYTMQLPELREYIRRLPEKEWKKAKKSLPSDLFPNSF